MFNFEVSAYLFEIDFMEKIKLGAGFKMFNFEVSAYLFEIKEGENFNHRNTCSISRIALKLH